LTRSPRPYNSTAREEAQQRTRQALLDAADEELHKGNWQKSSLQALSARAGVTKQTLLRHFGSKDGLLMQALLRGATQVLEQRWSAPSGDVSGAVENVIAHYEAWGERSLQIGTWENGPAFLAKLSQVARQVHYDWVDYAFAPWLEGLQEPARTRRRAALIATCDVHTWWLLTHYLELPRSEVHAIITGIVERLLADEA
jgi:AcrR family transcriptional regulator